MKDIQNSELGGQDLNWEEVRQRFAAANTALAGLDETTPEVMRQIWARRAAQLARMPVEEEEGERIELVLMRLGYEVYGFDAQYVYDIRPAGQITRVPRMPAWVVGVVNLRGRILSVLDLQRFFGLPEGNVRQESPLPYLVVVETPDMETTLWVDEVLAVEVLPASQVEKASDTIRGIRPEYVRGVAERQSGDTPVGGDGLLVVLDLLALLADERLIIHEEIV